MTDFWEGKNEIIKINKKIRVNLEASAASSVRVMAGQQSALPEY